jgi:hypothetical protein
MPEGPAERGVEANSSAHLVRSARRAESMDGAEHSGSIEPVMAGRHAAAGGGAFFSVSRCAVVCRHRERRGSTVERVLVRVDTARAAEYLVNRSTRLWSVGPGLLARSGSLRLGRLRSPGRPLPRLPPSDEPPEQFRLGIGVLRLHFEGAVLGFEHPVRPKPYPTRGQEDP